MKYEIDMLSAYLFARYGQPSGYGINIAPDGAEIFGYTHHAWDLCKQVSFDVRRLKSGVREILVTVRDTDPLDDNWARIYADRTDDSTPASTVERAIALVPTGTLVTTIA